jgi:hypothetical protein
VKREEDPLVEQRRHEQKEEIPASHERRECKGRERDRIGFARNGLGGSRKKIEERDDALNRNGSAELTVHVVWSKKLIRSEWRFEA